MRNATTNPTTNMRAKAVAKRAQLKLLHPGVMFLFRVGDNYELFSQDAENARGFGESMTLHAGEPLVSLPAGRLESYLREARIAGVPCAVVEHSKETSAWAVAALALSQLAG